MEIVKNLSSKAIRVRRTYGLMRFEPRALDGPIRVAIVGAGKAGQYHLEALKQIPGVEVTCLVHRGGSDLSALMRRYGIPICHVGIEEALSLRDFDAAIIAVDRTSTCEVATAFLDSGVHSLIEKPLGETIDDAAALLDCAARSRATSAVGYNRRCYSAVLEAERYVDALGAPYAIHVESPERLERIRKSGESPDQTRLRIVTNTCHAIDLFTVFAGEHEAVVSAGTTQTCGDVPIDYSALIRFRKGQTGQFSAHWSSPGYRVVTLYGRGYKLAIDMVRNELTVMRGKKVKKIGPRWVDRIFKAGVYLQDFEFMAAALAGVPVSAPLASVEDAFQTQRLACDLLNASSGNGAG
jgi:2-hydroxy-4-carboxymuconate semialdehyde hemiacetal dehydrogenase